MLDDSEGISEAEAWLPPNRAISIVQSRRNAVIKQRDRPCRDSEFFFMKIKSVFPGNP